MQVLLRSLHQGPKVDIWSAGVTLLYLIIGRTPFLGDNQQWEFLPSFQYNFQHPSFLQLHFCQLTAVTVRNMKDIVKLRGSESLWEVAKLHNRESAFPVVFSLLIMIYSIID